MLVSNLFLAAVLHTFACVAAGFRANDRSFQQVQGHRQQTISDPSPLEIDLDYAVYRGTLNTTTRVRTWFGIRYARAPTDLLRWQAPEPPVVNRTAVINANVRGPQCPQNALAGTTTRSALSTEDCLYLDVYSPANARDLPVLVYIHGGAYVFGNAGNSNLNYLLETNNNSFVGVVIQYRLGAFGFLGSADVSKFGSNNAGLLDQQFAMRWVQQYIASFGGNASHVTIAGESAGGGSVMLHTLSYGGSLGDSLFSNVIAASTWNPQMHKCDSRYLSQLYNAFAARAGCNMDTVLGESNETIFECLQKKDSIALQYASMNVSSSGLFATGGFTPCIDGDFITDNPASQVLQKRVNGRNLLVGNNAVEGAAFVDPNLSTIDDLVSWLIRNYPQYTTADISKILYNYPTDNQSYPAAAYGWATTGDSSPNANNISSFAIGQKQRAINIYSESNVICPSYWLNEAFAAAFQTSYHYQYSIPAGEHVADLYILLSRGRPWQSADYIRAFRTIWGNFIATSNPSISNSIANGLASNDSSRDNPASSWPSYDASNPMMMNLNSTGGKPTVVSGLLTWAPGNAVVSYGPGLMNQFTLANMNAWEGGRGARCDVWRSLSAFASDHANTQEDSL